MIACSLPPELLTTTVAALVVVCCHDGFARRQLAGSTSQILNLAFDPGPELLVNLGGAPELGDECDWKVVRQHVHHDDSQILIRGWCAASILKSPHVRLPFLDSDGHAFKLLSLCWVSNTTMLPHPLFWPTSVYRRNDLAPDLSASQGLNVVEERHHGVRFL